MEPILCAHLLRKVDEKLLDLLDSLHPEEWELPALAPGWSVRDVAAHLLDTPLRKLSMVRDGCVVEAEVIRAPQDLAALVNRLNREGVQVFRRLSPRVLIAQMRLACGESAKFHESLDPFAPAAFGVSWAGEEQSLNWFARELTERWHHQQQIRHATGRPGILEPKLYHPVLDCFLRGLPYAYRDTAAAPGTVVRVEVSGDCGGSWQIRREAAGWLMTPAEGRWDARVVVPQGIAWRVFTKGIARDEAERQLSLEGDRTLASQLLALTAIVA